MTVRKATQRQDRVSPLPSPTRRKRGSSGEGSVKNESKSLHGQHIVWIFRVIDVVLREHRVPVKSAKPVVRAVVLDGLRR